MFRKEPQNRKRRKNTPKKNRKTSTAIGIHQKRTRTAAFFGLLIGSLICGILIQTESWTPEYSPLQLTVTGNAQIEGAENNEKANPVKEEENPFQGPERIIDVSKIHPALGKVVDGKKVQQLPGEHEVTFTINPEVQSVAEKILADNDVPYGALVAVNPKTGKLIAFVDYQSKLGLHTGFALEATQPAASIFKVISSAALMESAGISPEKTVCYHGGKSRITKRELTPNRKRDTICRSLSDALAHSSNVVFARLADKHLNPSSLTDWGQRFGFNKPIPFLWTVEESRIELPTDRVKFAGSAAGFHHTYLSPLHGALLTAAVGNNGVIPMPHLVERIEREGIEIYNAETKNIGKAISESTARELTKMMTKTTAKGTGAKYFNKRHKILKGIDVAGKTGSLSSTIGGKRRHNSWFVAYAPADDPEIALAALVVNDPKWRIKGTYLGREVLEAYFLNKDK